MIDYGSPEANALLGGGSKTPSSSAPAKASKIDYGSPEANALLGSSVTTVKAPTATIPTANIPKMVASTPAPKDTSSLFSRTLKSMGNDLSSFWNTLTGPTETGTVKRDKEEVLKGTLLPGAKLTPDNFIPVESENTVKLPGNNGTLQLPKNFLSDIAKAGIELPEKTLRSYSETLGLSETSDKRKGPSALLQSYAESSGKYTADAIDDGVPGVAAIILGSAKAFGEFANDALLYSGPLSKAGSSTALEEKLFKNFIVENNLPKKVYFNGGEVQQMLAHGDMTSKETSDLVSVIGGDSAKIRNAFKNGITIDIPAEKIVTLKDKPYWAKIKKLIGLEPSLPKIVRTTEGKATEGVRGLLPGEGESSFKVPDVLKKDIDDHIGTHGIDATHLAIQEKLGATSEQASTLLTKHQQENVLANPESVAKATLEGIKEKNTPVDKPVQKVENKPAEPVTEKKKVEEPTQDDTPEGKFKSRVYERLREEHPELGDNILLDKLKLKEDSDRAVDLIIQDKNKAFRIAMGAETDENILQTSTNIAMAEKALEEGNNSLFAQLTKNRTLAQSRRGQELVAEKGSVTDNSTARYVKELIGLRLDKVGKKYLTDLSLETKGGVSLKRVSPKKRATDIIKKEVDKAKKSIAKHKQLDLDEAQALLDSLICK